MNEIESIIFKRYFEENSLTGHNIESFNKFIKFGLQRVVNEVKEISIDVMPPGVRDIKIKFGNIWVEKPLFREADGTSRKILPMEARLRDLTYEGPIFLEMSLVRDGVEGEKEVVQLGSLPIMLKSDLCYLKDMSREELIKAGEDPDDPGGYFIINGTERVVVTIEDLAPNKVFLENKEGTAYPWVGKVFSESPQFRVTQLFEKSKEGVVYVSLTARMERIPFVLLIKALGIEKDKDIVELFNLPEAMSDLYINLLEASEAKTREDALDIIGRKMRIPQSREIRIKRVEDILDRYLLPHIGNKPEDRLYKAYFIIKAVKKVLLFSYGYLEEDDKDHYMNKRLRLVGDLMEALFRGVFRMIVGDIKYNFERSIKRGKMPSLQSVTRSKFLTSRIRTALATGEWIGERHGVSQALQRYNWYDTLSHLRRVSSLLKASKENLEVRQLHPSHWGKLDPVETPDGQNMGLRKNLALLTEVSTESTFSESKIKEILSKMGAKLI